MARASRGPVTFRGSPMMAVVKTRPESIGPLPVSFDLPKHVGGTLEVEAYPDGDSRVYTVNLPRFTPPGQYKGKVVIDGSEQVVVAEVETEHDVRIVPAPLTVRARPGARVRVALTLINTSNVPVEIRNVHVLGVFREGGIEAALRQAYVAKLKKGERRIDLMAEGLAASHGGLVKIRLTKGAGTAGVDQVVDLEGSIQIPGTVEPGAVYSGNWEMYGMVYPIRIHVLGDKDKPEAPR